MPENKGPIMIVAGTRPEAIKLAPVIEWLDKLGVDYVFVWSGQHYDYEMSRIFFEQLGLPEPDKYLDVKASSDISEQVSKIMIELVRCIKEVNPTIIYALGDTNTTLSAALASVYTAKPYVHDEAGMRSFNSMMLEEMNRRIADAIASLRLAPTKLAVLNLLMEGIRMNTIRLVGSTAIDSLLKVLNIIEGQEDDTLSDFNVEKGQYIIITVHRRENLTFERLSRIVELLKVIAERLDDIKIVFPVHPHTRNRLVTYGLMKTLSSQKNVIISKPLGYIEFVKLMRNAKIVITDSGGVQEEAFILGKYMITLRRTTEWPETVVLGYNYLVDVDIRTAVDVIHELINSEEKGLINLDECPLGDGKAGQRVAHILKGITELKTLQRGLELDYIDMRDPYLIPSLTMMYYRNVLRNAYVCFDDNGIPLLHNNTFSYSKGIRCLRRATISELMKRREEIEAFIKVKWSEINGRVN